MRAIQALHSLYHPELPDFFLRLVRTPAMTRLQDVGMDCGCQYAALPLFRRLGPYSRLDHSLGTALIVWHFTGDPAQATAGLLHDVATPVFSHAVDFLLGDHLRQEATEARTSECIRRSPELMTALTALGLTVEQVEDYHRYPIADNDSPQLSADRLEYTLGDLLHYGFASLPQLARFYEDLTVWQGALAFRTPEIAADFVLASLRCSRVYVSDGDRYAMEFLARLLQAALERGCLTEADLMTTESHVIARLCADPACAARWRELRTLRRVFRASRPLPGGQWFQVPAKHRCIDPAVAGFGPVSGLDRRAAQALADFRGIRFSCWIGK